MYIYTHTYPPAPPHTLHVCKPSITQTPLRSKDVDDSGPSDASDTVGAKQRACVRACVCVCVCVGVCVCVCVCMVGGSIALWLCTLDSRLPYMDRIRQYNFLFPSRGMSICRPLKTPHPPKEIQALLLRLYDLHTHT
jgi:hypothetical protein